MYASAVAESPTGTAASPMTSFGFGGAAPSASAPARMHGGPQAAPGRADSSTMCFADEEASKQHFQYQGSGRGGYTQECKYRYVGDQGGEFEMITVRKKRPNYTLCGGLAVAVALVSIVYFSAHANSENRSGPKLVNQAGNPLFACWPQGLDPGERVMAAAGIAFQPAGLVTEGALGTVVVDGPDGALPKQGGEAGAAAGDRVVVVSWDGIPGLRHSRVTRDMIIRAIGPGEHVKAASDLEYKAVDPDRQAKLDVADLVRATQDLGGIRRGSYGTVVAVPADEDDAATTPGLDPGKLTVRFVNQLDTVRVRPAHVRKAPQVGDHVRALADVGGTSNGAPVVPRGAVGTVAAVTPAEDGMQFSFTVDWSVEGRPRMEASGEDLKTLVPPDGQTVLKGTHGITRAQRSPSAADQEGGIENPDPRLVVDWDGMDGPGADVGRRQLVKDEPWTTAKIDWCCSQGIGCERAGPRASSKPEKGAPHDCGKDDPQSWPVDKALWCCANKELGCDSHKPEEKHDGPIAVPSDFDPAPKPFVSTSRPALQGVA